MKIKRNNAYKSTLWNAKCHVNVTPCSLQFPLPSFLPLSEVLTYPPPFPHCFLYAYFCYLVIQHVFKLFHSKVEPETKQKEKINIHLKDKIFSESMNKWILACNFFFIFTIPLLCCESSGGHSVLADCALRTRLKQCGRFCRFLTEALRDPSPTALSFRGWPIPALGCKQTGNTFPPGSQKALSAQLMWRMSRKCCDLTVSKENGLAETSMRKCALCISPSSVTSLLDPLGIPQINPWTRAEVEGGYLPKDNFSLRDKTKYLTLLFMKVVHGFLLKAHRGVISLNYLCVSNVIPLQWLPGGAWAPIYPKSFVV